MFLVYAGQHDLSTGVTTPLSKLEYWLTGSLGPGRLLFFLPSFIFSLKNILWIHYEHCDFFWGEVLVVKTLR